MNPRSRRICLAALALSGVTGCGGGLTLTRIKSVENRPSNVAVYFKVQGSNGDPVGGITAGQFRIFEDGALVSQFESKQTILNPEVAAAHYTLLLVDMSGSVSSDPAAVESLVAAAGSFTERVGASHKVAVYAFDGSPDLHPIVPFTNGATAKAGVSTLAHFKPGDPSTNLNGAVIKGLGELDRAVAQSEQAMRFGTLVVFSDGTDRAARVPKQVMRKAVEDSKYDVFAIGLGAEMQESELKDVGKSGTARADDKSSVVKAFETIGARIEGVTRSYYLLSYCSPARAEKHEVRIEAVVKEADGKGERTGSLTSAFDAAGFVPGCDPNQRPNFDLSKGDALAPKKEEPRDKKDRPKAPPPHPRSPAPSSPPPPSPSPPPAPSPGREEFNP